jgi:hypothetical protein
MHGRSCLQAVIISKILLLLHLVGSLYYGNYPVLPVLKASASNIVPNTAAVGRKDAVNTQLFLVSVAPGPQVADL